MNQEVTDIKQKHWVNPPERKEDTLTSVFDPETSHLPVSVYFTDVSMYNNTMIWIPEAAA